MDEACHFDLLVDRNAGLGIHVLIFVFVVMPDREAGTRCRARKPAPTEPVAIAFDQSSRASGEVRAEKYGAPFSRALECPKAGMSIFQSQLLSLGHISFRGHLRPRQ
jgi:hypothetical protein